MRTQVTKQTGLAIGRIIPFGIGLVIGVAGARALGKNVIEGARKAFGPPPLTFPRVIEIAGPDDTPVILPAEPQAADGPAQADRLRRRRRAYQRACTCWRIRPSYTPRSPSSVSSSTGGSAAAARSRRPGPRSARRG